MKKKNCGCDYLESRNQNLRRVVFQNLGRNCNTIKDIFTIVARSPADRFYISEERAYHLISKLRKQPREEVLNNMIPSRRDMLLEIERRVSCYQRHNPGSSLYDAVFEVVNSPAPSFYLTPRSVRTIFYDFN